MIGVSLLLAEVAIYNLFFVVKNRFKINIDWYLIIQDTNDSDFDLRFGLPKLYELKT